MDIYIQSKAGSEPVKTGLYGIGVPSAIGAGAYDIHSMTKIFGDLDFDVVSHGDGMGLGIKDGKLYSWGPNANGRTGLGISTSSTITPYPTQIGSDDDWEVISAGTNSAAAIRGGKLYTWGASQYGKTGQGITSGTIDTPTQVGFDTDWEYVYCTEQNTFALKGGKILSCGRNQQGILGLGLPAGNNTTVDTFTELDGGSTGWTDLSATDQCVAAIKDGDVWTAGYNLNGRSAQGVTAGTTTTITKTVNGDTGDFVSVHYSRNALFAIKDNGNLWGAGANDILDNTSGNSSSMREVSDDEDWESFSMYCESYLSYINSIFALKGGKIYVKGRNDGLFSGIQGPDFDEFTLAYEPPLPIRQLTRAHYGHTFVLL